MHDTDRKYRDLIEATGTGYTILDEQGRVLDANEEFVRLTGHRTLADIKGRSVVEWTAQHDRERNAQEVALCLQNRVTSQLEIDYVAPDGSITPVEIHAAAHESAEGLRILALVQDITARKWAEAQLRKRQLEFETLATWFPSIVFHANPEGIPQYVNDEKWQEVTGQPSGSWRNDGWLSAVHSDDRRRVMATWKEAVATGQPWQEQFRFRSPDGHDVWVLARASPVISDHGDADGFVGTCSDISANKAAEDALWKLNRQILNTTMDGFVLADTHGRLIDVNLAYCRMIGYSRSELLEMNIRELECRLHDEAVEQRIAEIVQRGGALFETRHRRKDGREIDLDVSITLLRSGSPAPLAAAFVRDITTRKNNEAAVRLQSVAMDTASDGIVICDAKSADDAVIYVNRATTRLTGYSEEELIGKSLRILQGPKSDQEAAAEMRRAIRDGRSCNVEILNYRKDGQQFWNRVRITPLHDMDGTLTHFIGVQTDITKQKEVELALKDSEATLRSIAESSPDYIFQTDLNGNIQFINRTVPDLNVRDVIGTSVHNYVPEAFHQVVRETYQRVSKTGCPQAYEVQYHTKDGEVRHFEANVGPVLHDGNVVALTTNSRDVTERRREQEYLRHTERLASLGTLAAGIAHEINNPMSAAWAAAEAAKKVKGKAGKEPILDECLDAVSDAVQRCQVIIDNVLRFARQEPSEKEPCNLRDLVERAVETTTHFVNTNNSLIKTHHEEGLPHPVVNPAEIEQVLVNLIRNSVQAGATTIDVSTRCHDDTVCVSVKDNGQGIADSDLPHVFVPFFSSDESRGTGLGLSICYGIVEDHDGRIEADSKIGEGATFTIWLPIGKSQDFDN